MLKDTAPHNNANKNNERRKLRTDRENEDTQTAGDIKDKKNYVTIQTIEGIKGALREIDNAKNFRCQQRLGLARYKIPETPRPMRNIPKFYTSK